MPGSAPLDTNVLVDDLIPDVVDGLRDELHPAFGVRPYRVFTVVRTWDGGFVGSGNFSDVEVELTPQPNVHLWERVSDLHNRMTSCGLDQAGAVLMTEVSLTYTQEELLACAPTSEAVQHLLKVTEAHGQGQKPRYFVHEKPPYPDRVKDMGWVLQLELAESEC